MNDPRTPRVLLQTLSQRTSAKGNSYLSGYLGKTSVVGFPGEPDRFGNETWNLLVSPAPPRQQSPAVAVPAQRGAWGDGPDAGDKAAAGRDFLHKGRERAHAREGSR